MHVRYRRMGKSAGSLAGFNGRVDPAFGKERLGNFAHAWIKGVVGVHHGFLRLIPGHQRWVFHWQGRVAVPDLHDIQTQPFAFQLVIAVRQFGIGVHDRVAQRIDHFGFDLVRQMAAVLGRRHVAPAVKDFLFLGLSVVHTGKDLDVLGKYARQFFSSCLPFRPLGVGQEIQRGFDVQRLAVDLERQTRDGFIEQAFPRVANNPQIVQELFQLVRQLVRFHGADSIKNRLIARKIGVLGQQAFQMVIVKPVQLEREEHQRRGKVGDLFLQIRHELGAVRVGGQLIIAQARKRHDAPGDVVDLFIAQHAFKKTSRIKRSKVVFIVAGKAGTGCLQPFQIAFQLGRIFASIKIVKVPLRQIPQVAASARGIGIPDGKWQLEHEWILSSSVWE